VTILLLTCVGFAAYYVWPFTPAGSRFVDPWSEPVPSPEGGHLAKEVMRYYGFSADEVAVFVDGLQVCDWHGDEYSIKRLQWLDELSLQVTLRSPRPLQARWWTKAQAGAVTITWDIGQ
jgi:hypothetical protein